MATPEERREARNRYAREWYKRNKERVKATQERHWDKVAEQHKKDEPQENR